MALETGVGKKVARKRLGTCTQKNQNYALSPKQRRRKTRLGSMAKAWLSREIYGPSAETNYLWQVTAFLKAARHLPRSTILFDLDWLPKSGQCTSPSWSFCYSRSRNIFPIIPSNK